MATKKKARKKTASRSRSRKHALALGAIPSDILNKAPNELLAYKQAKNAAIAQIGANRCDLALDTLLSGSVAFANAIRTAYGKGGMSAAKQDDAVNELWRDLESVASTMKTNCLK